MNYNKTLVYLMDKCEEQKNIGFTVLTDKGDSSFAYPGSEIKYKMQIIITNGMISWLIKGYIFPTEKQNEVHTFVDKYNKKENRKYTMHFLPWEKKVAISSMSLCEDNEMTIKIIDDAIKFFMGENAVTKDIKNLCL